MGYSRRALSASLIVALVSSSVAFGAEGELAAIDPPEPPALLFYPDSPGVFDWRIGAGLLVDVLPVHIVESEQRQFPQLTGAIRLGLPWRFSADLRVRAIAIQNQVELGVGWSFRAGALSLAFQNHLGVWFGFVGVDGFDASAWGLVETPGIVLGLPWREVRFSLTTEAIITFAQQTTLGDATKSSRRGSSLSGIAATMTVETLLASGGVPYFGAGLLWTQPDYQAWLAFSDERARVFYPRFVGGYAF